MQLRDEALAFSVGTDSQTGHRVTWLVEFVVDLHLFDVCELWFFFKYCEE